MPPSPVEELALLDLDRSNKGASKQRRDQINSEIAHMRDLLPLPETARQRLSQLQIMSLSCVYIRKCNVMHKLFRSFPEEKDVPATCDFFQALTGFLLITTREGKLVYISENVTDYLGHSMVDMKTQGDSLYDIVDKRDHGTVQAQLLQGGTELDVTRDVAFFCRMNMSRTLKRQAGFGDVKVMHVRGHFIPLSDLDSDTGDQTQQQQQKYVFMATCCPLITPELKENLVQSNTMVFKTVHQLDMTFLEVTNTAEYYLGYTTEEIFQRSWYSMLHPEDIHEAREKHILLIRSSHEMGCMLTVRMLSADGQVVWVNIVMHVRQASNTQNDEPLIVCINQVISEQESYQIRMQSHLFTLYPPRSSDVWATGLTVPHSASLPPQPQPEASTHWMPATTGLAPATHGSSYQGPVNTYYVTSQQRQTLPTCTVNYSMHDTKNYHSSSSPPSGIPLPPGQTEKLKLMLKRKIQGPCRPAKVPKMAWDEHTEGGQSGSRQGFEYAATGDPMHSPDSASQFFSTSGGYSWPASTQLVPQAQYRVAHVLPDALVQHNVKAHLMSSPCPVLSPPLPSVNEIKEQVVPENSVAVPESYLTPDPSPATSPHPHTCNVHTDSTQVKTAPTPAAILYELQKMASLPPVCPVPVTSGGHVQQVKVEKMDDSSCCQTGRQRGLPIMDAFDIESFFDTLDCGEIKAGIEEGTKEKVDELNTTKVYTKQEAKQSIPKAYIKQEPIDIHTCPLSEQCQVPAPLHIGLRDEAHVEPTELEELLGFFSGHMTSTHLDPTEDVSSVGKKTEADALVETAKTWADSCSTTVPCDVSHFGNFLLHNNHLERPLEEFSPVSSTASDINSEMSGDEESSCEEPPEACSISGQGGSLVKQEGRRRRRKPAPSHNSPSHDPTFPNSQMPQDVPGITEEDELYQLNKLLSTMISDNDAMLSGDSQ